MPTTATVAYPSLTVDVTLDHEPRRATNIGSTYEVEYSQTRSYVVLHSDRAPEVRAQSARGYRVKASGELSDNNNSQVYSPSLTAEDKERAIEAARDVIRAVAANL